MKIFQESYCQMEKPRAGFRQTMQQRIATAIEIEEAATDLTPHPWEECSDNLTSSLNFMR